MALWKRILGLEGGGGGRAGGDRKPAADAEVDELLRMLEADSAPAAETEFTAKNSTPKEAMRYIFHQLLSGCHPGSVADGP